MRVTRVIAGQRRGSFLVDARGVAASVHRVDARELAASVRRAPHAP